MDTPDGDWFEQLANGSETLLFYLLRVKPDVAFEYVNAAVETLFGCTVGEALADPTVLLGSIDAAYSDRLAAVLALPPGRETVGEYTWRHRNGHSVHGRTYVRSRQRADGSVVLEGLTRDMTQLHKMQAELRQSEKRYRLLVENGWDVVWTTAVDGTVTYVSPAVERLRGFSVEETLRQSVGEVYPPESAKIIREYVRSMIAAVRNGNQPPVFRLEYEFYHRDGSTVEAEMMMIPHLDEDGRVLEMIGVTRDITERKAFEAELRRLAVTDPVTGLWNRRYGAELLSADLRGTAHSQSSTVLMLDVDRFKTINDTRGHQAGDRVLIEISRRLLASCRDTDVVTRWGGEEFLILLRDCTLQEALTIAEELRTSIARTPFLDAGTVTVSIGVAQATPDDDMTSLVVRADEALFEAKRSGRNTVRAC